MDNTPLEQLRESLGQSNLSLTNEQIRKIKNIVLKMGRYAIKDAYLMQNGCLMTSYAAGRNYDGIVTELIRIMSHIPMEHKLQTNILLALMTMFPSVFCHTSCPDCKQDFTAPKSPDDTHKCQYYAAFDALEKDINSQ